MIVTVADTSALVSLGTVVNHEHCPLDILLNDDRVVIPERVIDELRETASYTDVSGEAAQAVLNRLSEFDIQTTELDEDFLLDDGENAAIKLANDLDAMELLCDEFNRLAIVHASLADVHLVTTPTLLTAFVRNDILSAEDAESLLTEIGDASSWKNNTYVARAEATLQQESATHSDLYR